MLKQSALQASLVLVFGILAASAAKADITLRCSGMGDVQGQSTTLTLIDDSTVAVDGSTADLDQNYNPRLNYGFQRFQYESSDEGVQEVLVQDQLLEGAERGMIKVQYRGEGYESESYYCHP